MNAAFAFAWEVPDDGFQIVRADMAPGRHFHADLLTNDLPIGSRYRARRIEPLDRPALFREFADLKSPEAILRFANVHGRLGLPPRKAITKDGRIPVTGEMIQDWTQQIKHLRRAISAWERAERRPVMEAIAPFLTDVLPCFVSDKQSSRLVFVPQNLLAAIWLQFALAVQGGKEFRRCGGCDAWIDRGLYCNAACRQRAYRKRKAKQ
jgi:hypothetical protein